MILILLLITNKFFNTEQTAIWFCNVATPAVVLRWHGRACRVPVSLACCGADFLAIRKRIHMWNGVTDQRRCVPIDMAVFYVWIRMWSQ